MLKNIIRLSVCSAVIYILTSCNSGKPKNQSVGKDIFALADSMAAADSVQTVVKEDLSFKDYPLTSFDDDSTVRQYPATILTTGLFHNEEVHKEDSRLSWYGIFQNGDGYYIDTARVLIKKAFDPIADDEGGKITGWQVKTANSDTSLLLFAGVNGLEKRQIKEISLRKKEIQPGDSVTYAYNGNNYTLFATGDKEQEEPGAPVTVSNYRLFIKSTINGAERTQMLVAARGFDDRMTGIMFAGDIDGDNIPDLIINTSYHYNATIPTLYLSKPAGSNEVLKLMGWHVSVGC